jgi:hypothetical protein
MAIAGLAALALPAFPAIAATNDYEACTSTLLGLKISSEEASSACAKAFLPNDLATCVSTITAGNPTPIADVLSACRKVRRPIELSNCVVDIRKDLSGASAPEVLGYCRRSLLPERYASCVLGISSATKFSPSQSMATCINAGDYYPAELEPTFIPYQASSGAGLSPITPPLEK